MSAAAWFVLAQEGTKHAFQPFRQPLPVWDLWYLLLIPLCAGVSIVYKAIKCESMRQVPRQALGIFLWITLGMAGAAAGLVILVKLMDR